MRKPPDRSRPRVGDDIAPDCPVRAALACQLGSTERRARRVADLGVYGAATWVQRSPHGPGGNARWDKLPGGLRFSGREGVMKFKSPIQMGGASVGGRLHRRLR